MQHPSAEATDDLEDKDEVDEDGEEDDSVDEDIGEDNGDRQSQPSSCLIARTITLQMLLADHLLEPGEGAMSIEYMGQRFIGDLLPDGKIRSQETDIVFVTPSAWAVNCRRIINPGKKSGCGWASIRYKGRKLDAFKNIWINRRNEEREKLSEEANDYEFNLDKENKMLAPPPPPPPPSSVTSAATSATTVTTTVAMVTATATAAMSALATTTLMPPVITAAIPQKPMVRMPVKHHNIGNRTSMHDPNMLVESTSFSALGKIQPFLVSMSTNAMLVMDFHCHLTTSEVCGYLAGQWDVNAHNLSITMAFPCRSRLDDQANGPLVEKEIRNEIEQRGLIPVGWYHSHPMLPASPSLRDIDKQLDHEMHMKGSSDSSYTPCIGVICSPYFTDTSNVESSIVSFWVAPPPENKPLEYGKPMLMNYSVVQDLNLHTDVLKEMKALIEFYKDMHDFIDFNKVYKSELTYLEKLKATLSPKFPKDQTDGVLWGFIRQLVTPGFEEHDSDGNVKIYSPETTTVITPPTATSTNSTCPTTLVVPMVVPGSRGSVCNVASNSVNSNCHSAANSTASTTGGFFLGSDMTSAILAAGKLPAGTSLMSVMPGNNQNMFMSPMGLNMLNNSSTNKGCKTTTGTNMSNLATISSLGNLSNLSNLGNLGNLGNLANLANLNNLSLGNIGNLGNLASISLSNKNVSGSNLSTNNFRNNVSLSVSLTNASSTHASTACTMSHSLLNSSVSTVTSAPSCTVSSLKSSNNASDPLITTDDSSKLDNDSAVSISVNLSKEESSSSVHNVSLSNTATASNNGSVNNTIPLSNSVNNVSSDMNGSKVLNNVSIAPEKTVGNQSESDVERPAKIAKLDGTSIVTR